MRTQISYIYDKTDGKTGLYVAEGYLGRHGSFMKRFWHHRDTVMAVMCRGEKTEFSVAIKRLEQWFCTDFPQMVHSFSAAVVERYWYDILNSKCQEKWAGSEIMILLVHRGQYVFCGAGNFNVYEYFPVSGKYRRWYTCAERMKMDKELGLRDCEQQKLNLIFQHRVISENTFFSLLPGLVSLDSLMYQSKKFSFMKMLRVLAGQFSCVVGIRVLPRFF